MTDKLTDNDKIGLAEQRIKRAWGALEEADYNAAGGYFIAAMNRLYYAAYYAVSALLAFNGIEAATHAGIKNMLSLHFIKTGLLSTEIGKIYGQLFDCRQSGDYDDFVYYDKTIFDENRPRTEKLLMEVSDLMPSLNNSTFTYES